MTVFTDAFSRRLSYLRLSVTDLCNYRCQYCLPNGYEGKANKNELTTAEIAVLVKAFAAGGTRKIRLTGGEPTLRADLAQIIATCKQTEGIEHVALTTNAFGLDKKFSSYQQAGLDQINISIDSFRPDVFFAITGKRECLRVIHSLDKILAQGFRSIKVNTLLLRRYADHTIEDALDFVKARDVTLRFIELMQTGDNFGYFSEQHLAAATMEERLLREGWQLLQRGAYAGPAREYQHEEFRGRIGFIAPYSKDFCKSCNRLRVTAQGAMHLCLFGGVAYDIRPFLQQQDATGLTAYVHELLQQKPEQHYLHDKRVGLIRDLSMIGG